MHTAAMTVIVGMLASSRVDEPCDAWQHWLASDIRGADLQQARASTLDVCKMVCLHTADCRAFTWPGCQLKSSKERIPSDAYAVVERPSIDQCAPTDSQGHAVGAADGAAGTVPALTVRTTGWLWSDACTYFSNGMSVQPIETLLNCN